MQCQLFTLVLLIATLFTQTHAAEIEIERDRWGTPHIYATSEADALYGLGYATAEDRALQMTYQLRIIQGRLAEVVGDIRMNSRQDTAVTNDRKMRTFGFYRAAKQVASQLDANTQNLLQAYCDGVNAYFAEHPSVLDQRGNGISIQHEPWTVADCLVSWWHLGQFFATDGTRELIAARNQAAVTLRTAAPGVELMPPDDAPRLLNAMKPIRRGCKRSKLMHGNMRLVKRLPIKQARSLAMRGLSVVKRVPPDRRY